MLDYFFYRGSELSDTTLGRFRFSSVTCGWSIVAVTSVAFMGLYALMIVLARTPGISTWLGSHDFFKTGLVTHVVLAVVIWFLAFLIFVMHYVTKDFEAGPIEKIPVYVALLGIILIVVTPYTGDGNPILNNYVPVLDRKLYLAGLSIFLLSALAGAVLRFGPLMKSRLWPLLVRGALMTAGFALLCAICAITLSYIGLAKQPQIFAEQRQFYYEALFWGGGHVLQFANTLGLLSVWTILYSRLSSRRLVPDRYSAIILFIIALFILGAPVSYFFADDDSANLRTFFTQLKGWGLAVGPVLVGSSILMGVRDRETSAVAKRGLYVSLFLFALGGTIALTLTGSNTKVPAHYHGVIGAVTLAFMTFGFVTMLENGWMKVREKLLLRQINLYGIGQTMFVCGLFTGGTRGVPRKTFGAEQHLDGVVKYIGMGIMGIGGLFAISAGVMFVLFMISAFRNGYSMEKKDA